MELGLETLKITVFTKPNCLWCSELLDRLQPIVEQKNVIVSPLDSTQEDLSPYLDVYGKITIPSVLIGDVLLPGIPEIEEIWPLVLGQTYESKASRVHTFSCFEAYSGLMKHLINRIFEAGSPGTASFIISNVPHQIPNQFWQIVSTSLIFFLSDFENIRIDDRPAFQELLNHENAQIGHIQTLNSWFIGNDGGFMKAKLLGDIIYGTWSITSNVSLPKMEIISTFITAWECAMQLDNFLNITQRPLDLSLILDEIEQL